MVKYDGYCVAISLEDFLFSEAMFNNKKKTKWFKGKSWVN